LLILIRHDFDAQPPRHGYNTAGHEDMLFRCCHDTPLRYAIIAIAAMFTPPPRWLLLIFHDDAIDATCRCHDDYEPILLMPCHYDMRYSTPYADAATPQIMMPPLSFALI